jgi:GGDEF domain-containing protein
MGWFARGRLWAAALLFLAASLLVPAAGAREVLRFDGNAQPVMLRDAGDAWMDPTGQVEVDQVLRDTRIRWQPTAAHGISQIGKGHALWLRFTVPAMPAAEHWYLEIPYPAVDKVTLYVQDAAGRWMVRSAGDALRVSDWPQPHRHPLLPIVISASTPQVHLLRIENGTHFGAPLQFVSDSTLGRGEQGVSLMLGTYFGLVLLAVVLAITGALTLKDHGYTLYAVSAVLMALMQASLTGLAGLHLWGDWPWWNDMAPQVLPLLASASINLFLAEVVSLRERSRPFYRVLAATALLSLPLALYVMITPDAMERLRLMVVYCLASIGAGLGALAWSARRGDRYARWLLVGALPVAFAGLFPMARAAGLLPIGFWTTHGMQIGIAAELPILLLVLAMRSQHRREHVRRIQGLDRIDPATGLINAAVFHERLGRLITRSRRLKVRSAMLLVDIANLEQIRRHFDGDSARELTLRVAGRLLSIAREIDTVARLSDHRFGILLEGPLRAEEVAEAGPRIVARCLMPFEGRPLEWTAQVRVAQALIPLDGDDPSELVQRLEMLLASSPESRRAVFTLSKPTVPAALME